MARVPIIMPKMSMTMTEGEVSGWMAKVGDVISEGDVVCEVMTDKVDMEVESTVAGTLVEIVAAEGTIVVVGDPIGWVEGQESALGDLFGGGDVGSVPGPTQPDPPAATTVVTSEVVGRDEPDPSSHGPVAAVPRARGLAREQGIDLSSVRGSGPDGLVTITDVEALIAPPERSATQTTAPRASAAPPNAPVVAAAGATTPSPAVTGTSRSGGKDRAASIRAAVARKMMESAAVPQFTVWRDLDLDAVDSRRDVSWTTVLLQSYAAALREVPELLTRWEEGRATPSGPPAVALAVATPYGLLVPVFTEPDRLAARDLDREVKEVVAAAQAGRLDPAYLGVANASLSNLGGLGVDRFQALVTPPQASVLSLGSIKHRPVAVPGGIGVTLSVTAGLTVDHRVGDGAHAARLLDSLARHVHEHAS